MNDVKDECVAYVEHAKMNEGKVNWEELSAERFSYELWESNWAYRLGFDYCTDTNDFLLKKFRVHFVGWCDGSRLAVRPKSDMVAVMCEDENGDKFWFHIYKTTFEILMERDKNEKNV